jgi:hypothetical protein
MYRTITTLIAAAFAATTHVDVGRGRFTRAERRWASVNRSVHGRTDQQFWGEATWENRSAG